MTSTWLVAAVEEMGKTQSSEHLSNCCLETAAQGTQEMLNLLWKQDPETVLKLLSYQNTHISNTELQVVFFTLIFVLC